MNDVCNYYDPKLRNKQTKLETNKNKLIKLYSNVKQQ